MRNNRKYCAEWREADGRHAIAFSNKRKAIALARKKAAFGAEVTGIVELDGGNEITCRRIWPE